MELDSETYYEILSLLKTMHEISQREDWDDFQAQELMFDASKIYTELKSRSL